jgi:hypothetical protein
MAALGLRLAGLRLPLDQSSGNAGPGIRRPWRTQYSIGDRAAPATEHLAADSRRYEGDDVLIRRLAKPGLHVELDPRTRLVAIPTTITPFAAGEVTPVDGGSRRGRCDSPDLGPHVIAHRSIFVISQAPSKYSAV